MAKNSQSTPTKCGWYDGFMFTHSKLKLNPLIAQKHGPKLLCKQDSALCHLGEFVQCYF